MSSNNAGDRPRSAVDAALGGLLSWVTGKDSVKRGRSAVDGALGELLSWITGRGGRKDPDGRPGS
ncbi:MAG TPA: hypothetical protein VGP05_05295 [Pseudonocardia sp.]|jgi:hypothetical protein|nr:hypothetical protein [Pseudonocardia sp.]